MASTKLGMRLTATAAPELFKNRTAINIRNYSDFTLAGHITESLRLFSKELALGNMRSMCRMCCRFMIYVRGQPRRI